MDKLSVSVRVLENNGYHVRCGIHASLIPVTMEHQETNRALCGTITLRNDEFLPFLQHIQPHLVYDLVVTEDQPVTLAEYFELLGGVHV